MLGSRRKTILFGSALVVLVNASLFVSLLSLTVSWFSTKKAADAVTGGLIVGDDSDGAKVELDAFKYDIDKGQGYKLDESVTNDYKMNSHDTIFTANNEWTPMIFRMMIKNPNYKKDDSLKVTVSHNTSLDNVDHDVGLSPYISSTLGIKCAIATTSTTKGGSYKNDEILHESNADNITENDVYLSAKNFFEAGEGQSLEEKTFVTKEENYVEDDSLENETDPIEGQKSYSSTDLTSISFTTKSADQTIGSTSYPSEPSSTTGSQESGLITKTYIANYSVKRSQGFVIKSGNSYLSLTNNGFSSVQNVEDATILTFTRSGNGYTISGYRPDGRTTAYLRNRGTLQNSTTSSTWTISYNQGFSISSTYNNRSYYLVCNTGTWTLSTTAGKVNISEEFATTAYTKTKTVRTTYVTDYAFTKNKSLSFDLTHTGEETIYLYFYLNYNASLLKTYSDLKNGGSFHIENVLNFGSDLTTVQVSSGGNE